MRFAPSARGTLGVEWELALVDLRSRELAPVADAVMARIDDPRVKGEFFTNTVEIITGVHERTDTAVDEMRELRDAVLDAAEREGVGVIGAGAHPFSPWRTQQLSDSPRYRRLVELVGSWAERLVIFGVHDHVGLDRPEAQAMPALRALVEQLPLLLALSASSPFWQGEDSGYASQRMMLFQQLPSGGLPPRMDGWDDWCRAAHDLVHIGAVHDVGEVRWDVRPSPRLGTIESRIPDGAASLDDLAAVTALTHCMVEERLRQLDAGEEPEALSEWFLRDNKWRAAKLGLDAVIVTDAEGATAPVRSEILSAVERLAPIAEDLGATSGLEAVERVIERGGSAALQREAAGEGMPAVVDHLVAELQR